MAYPIPKKSSGFKDKPFELKDYYEVGKENGLNTHDSIIFAEFMRRRFPDEKSNAYVKEWAKRFKSGNPESYMDEESKSAYLKAREKFDGI